MTSSIRSSRFLDRSTLALVLGMITLTACGGSGSSLAAPSTASAVTLNGSVVGPGGASSSVSGATSTGLLIPGALTVSVLESPALTATIGGDGSFTLRGLPTDSFTLVFARDGARIGALSFTAVLPNQELNVTISVTDSSLVLLEEQRNGIGHGDLEIEGSVEQVLLLSQTGDSRFIIRSRTVVARPGQTVIREGNTLRRPADLRVGLPVHVKAVWLPVEGATQPVLAREIKIQAGDDRAPAPSPTPTPRADCMLEGGTPGRGIELQGTITEGNASFFKLAVEGGRASNPVDVLAGGARHECTPQSGPDAPTPAQCSASVKPGARVHVSGILSACSATGAEVSADRVSVRK